MHKIFRTAAIAAISLLCGLSFSAMRLNAQDVFECYFADAEEFVTKWTAVDANHDRYTWGFNGDSYDEETGSIMISSYEDVSDGLPEYVVLKEPLHLEPGNYNFSFFHKETGWPEQYGAYWGRSNALDVMTPLLERSEVNRAYWAPDFANFTVEEEGDYYFAIASYHNGGKGYYIGVDAVKVSRGDYVGSPDLQVSVKLPLSSCALGEQETLKILVENVGTENVTKVKVSYSVDSGETLTKEIAQTVAAFGSKELRVGYINLSGLGLHTVSVEVEAVEHGGGEELVLENNTGSAVVQKWELLEELPFETYFSRPESAEDWDAEGNSWGWYPRQGYMLALGTGALYSRCVPLAAGHTYRFSYNYLAGYAAYGTVFYENFEVLYGLSGTELSSWKTLLPAGDHYTGLTFTDEDYTFTPESDGLYSFAIRCPEGTHDYLAFRRITVSEVFDYDVAVVGMGPLPVQVPAEHLSAGFSLPVTVRNMGSETVENVKVSLALDNKPVGEDVFALGEPEAVVRRSVAVSAEAAAASGKIVEGRTVTLTAQAEITGHEDKHGFDNIMDRETEITHNVLACDGAGEDLCETANGVGGYEVGSPLTLLARDTLTGVRIFWTESEVFEFTFALYRFDPVNEELGDKIYYDTYRKTAEAGVVDYDLPAILLDAGTYLMTVYGKGFALVCDGSETGRLYLVEDGMMEYQPGTGAAAIRALFDNGAASRSRDAAIGDIYYPAEEGYYTVNQTIKALVTNNGSENLDVTVKCRIDGVEADSARRFTLPAYNKTDVAFTGDLSALGSHTVTVEVSADNDEDPSNNTLSKEFVSIPPEDPYVMDFEHCEDFTFDNFNPVWRSVDMDGALTHGNSGVTFPHQGEAFGFIVFNPAAVGGEYVNIVTYDGERLGMTFCSFGKPNDDWLISPLLRLPPDSAWIKLMVRSYNDRYGLEQYQILVSETGLMEDFDTVFEGSAPARVWEEVCVNLNAWAGKSVYIAIRCVSDDVFSFMVDYIRVSRPADAGIENGAVVAGSGLELKLYPNPARDVITIVAEAAHAASLQRVDIFDVQGRKLYTSPALQGRNSFRYNVSHLQPGLYVARVQTSTGTAALKFLVK